MEEYFFKCLLDFCKNTKEAYDRCNYPYAPFVPYALDEKAYFEAPLKVFYMGKDTLGWNKKESLFNLETDVERYLATTGKVVNLDYLKSNGNNCGFFWKFVQRLHLQLMMGCPVSDLSSLNGKQYNCISQIGYGNLFALEQKICKSIDDKESLKTIQYYANPFERIKNILDFFTPDVIFIFGWIEKKSLWEGVKESCLQDFFVNNKRSTMGQAVFSIEGYKTRVLWFPHPQYLNFRFDLKDCIDDIVNTWKSVSSYLDKQRG